MAKVQDLVDFINHEIELLDKKSGKKAVKVTEEQVAIQGAILVALEELGKAQVKDLIKTEVLKDVSSQRVSAMLKKLVESGEVIRTEEKKVAFFSIA